MHEEKLAILEAAFGETTLRRQGRQAYFLCPLCDHPKKKLNVNLDDGSYHCWVCNASGRNVGYLLKKHNQGLANEWLRVTKSSQPITSYYEEEDESVSLPNDFVSLSNPTTKNCPYYKRCVTYLVDERKIKWSDIEKMGVGFTQAWEYRNYAIFPSYDLQGDLNFFVARAIYRNMKMKYKNPSADKTKIVFNELFVDFRFPIVLVEGVFDTLKGGDNFVPLLGNSLGEDHRLLEQLLKYKPKVYVALDADAQDRQAQIGSTLTGYGIDAYLVDLEGYKDIGEIHDRTEVKRLIESASKFRFKNKVRQRLEKAMT